LPVAYTHNTTTGTLSRSHPSTDGSSVVTPLPQSTTRSHSSHPPNAVTAPASIDATLSSASESPHPPPFSSLYFPSQDPTGEQRNEPCDTQEDDSPPAFAAAPPFTQSSSSAAATAVAETKAALPRDTKHGSPRKDVDDGEPPPPYSEGSSPLDSFTYVMASAGGPASIITQVSQSSAGPPINTLGGSDENITLELRYAVTPFGVRRLD
jgi:ATP-binding cassette subfamily F protein 3